MTEDSVAVIIERLDNLKKEVSESKLEANEWRIRFMERLNQLPCDVRCEETKGIKQQLLALWAITGGMVLAILSEWVKLK